jgi:hypothetical protein
MCVCLRLCKSRCGSRHVAALAEQVPRTKKLAPDHRLFSAKDFQQYLQSAEQRQVRRDSRQREHYKVCQMLWRRASIGAWLALGLFGC